jgi:hypothetical protein
MDRYILFYPSGAILGACDGFADAQDFCEKNPGHTFLSVLLIQS